MRDYSAPPPVPASMWTNPLHFIAFGFGSGAMPFAPGTFGTLVGVVFYLLIAHQPLVIYLTITLFAIAVSSWICDKVSKEISVHDHQGMSLDEVVGFLVTMIGVPHKFIWIALGFGLFRLFDIWKPWPIGFVDRKVDGGFGMILDDVLAGVYACLILQLITRLI